ncbi:hypothetical protein B0H14DRAFT_6056 [Mycena olivaceomarginata]|nr:hypothetical protein B0H14DRAFT_6056 [Mycena olivaceomarginata]
MTTRAAANPCQSWCGQLQPRQFNFKQFVVRSRRDVSALLRRHTGLYGSPAPPHGNDESTQPRNPTVKYLRNATARTGEGMHQEVAQHYMYTNFKDVPRCDFSALVRAQTNSVSEVAHRDEEQEAISCTRLTVDDFFRRTRNEGDGDQDEEENLKKDLSQFRDGSNRKIPHSKIPAAKGKEGDEPTKSRRKK